MQRTAVDAYLCPYTRVPLRLEAAEPPGDEIASGSLVTENGGGYQILDGIPHLLRPELEEYTPDEAREKQYYEATAREYDAVLDWLFQSFRADETAVREKMISFLELEPGAR